jgi:hypothetical protein
MPTPFIARLPRLTDPLDAPAKDAPVPTPIEMLGKIVARVAAATRPEDPAPAATPE